MGDYNRNSNQDRNFDRDRDQLYGRDKDRQRFDERRLDDRTGYGPPSAGGYKADRSYQGATDYGRDDQYGSNYGGFEDRSFGSSRSSSDYDSAPSAGGYYGGASGQDRYGADPYGYDRSSYSSSARDYQTNRSQAPRSSYSSEAFGGRTNRSSSTRESYAFNPYESYGRNETSGRNAPYRSEFGSDHDEYRGRDDDRGFFEKVGDRVASWFSDDDRRGEHHGRGPKGYKRSDDRIREDISDRLADDSWLDASDVEVIVSDAEATLVGTVSDRDAKRRAESLAERISGVKHVQNNLRVSQLNRATDTSTTTGAGTVENPTLNKQAAGRA